jgi:hypothetical protein
MSGAFAIVMVVAALGVIVTIAYRGLQAQQRADQAPAVAAAKGLEFAETDTFGSTSAPFGLMGTGDGRRITNIMWDPHDGEGGQPGSAWVFDYGYYEISRDRNGTEMKVWSWFTCALAQTGGQWPALRIARANVADKARELLGHDPIRFESEEFNTTFTVTCDDRRFASALIDPQMMQFLLTTKGALDIEVKGRFVLLSSDELPIDESPIVLGLARELVERVPAAAWALYPKVAPAAAPEAVTGAAPTASEPFPSVGDLVSAADAWDPTPGVDYDLDGHAIAPNTEDPWQDHPLRPHDERPPDRPLERD